jgi:hypothetical protein
MWALALGSRGWTDGQTQQHDTHIIVIIIIIIIVLVGSLKE